MRPRNGKVTYLDLVLVAFILAAFLFASPFHLVWMTPEFPWYAPYVLWFCVIVLTAIVQRWRGRNEL